FFFQAEDGIRDKLVTGVQTCALPIFAGLGMPEDADREPRVRILERLDRPVVGVRRDAQALAEPAEALVVMRLYRRAVAAEQLTRSEERRVGKEWSSRRRPAN